MSPATTGPRTQAPSFTACTHVIALQVTAGNSSTPPPVSPDTLLRAPRVSADTLPAATSASPDTLPASPRVSADTLPAASSASPDTLLMAPRVSADTLRSDTAALPPARKIPEKELHSPRKASIYSALLPGLGQAYNKKYWKIPIIYGGFAAFGYFIGWNNRNFKTARQAYSDLTDTIPSTDSYMKLKQIIYYDLSKPSDVASLKQGLTSSQDYYRRNRDLLIIVTAAFYGLNIIDASVDAHFFNFDISDDLSLNWEPVMRQAKNQNIFCLNCTLRF